MFGVVVLLAVGLVLSKGTGIDQGATVDELYAEEIQRRQRIDPGATVDEAPSLSDVIAEPVAPDVAIEREPSAVEDNAAVEPEGPSATSERDVVREPAVGDAGATPAPSQTPSDGVEAPGSASEPPPSAPSPSPPASDPDTPTQVPPAVDGQFAVVVRSSDPELQLKVRCNNGQYTGVGQVVIADARRGPCVVSTGSHQTGMRRAHVVITGPAQFTCFASGQSSCE